MHITKNTVVNIPSGLGGVLPALVLNEAVDSEGKIQVRCIHEEFYPLWILNVPVADIKPCLSKLHPIKERVLTVARNEVYLGKGWDWIQNYIKTGRLT